MNTLFVSEDGEDLSSSGREWLAMKRCLVLLKRLFAGPADGDELIEAVYRELGEGAYSPEAGARERALKRDREHLRRKLGVKIRYDPRARKYVLEEAGLFAMLRLSPPSLAALSALILALEGGTGATADFRRLIDELLAHLPPEDRLKLEQEQPAIELDWMQSIDPARAPARVWRAAERAIHERRKLAFNYLSPQQTDRQPRYHEIAPYSLRFVRGHWYLRGCDLRWRNAQRQEWFGLVYRNFRLVYILDDERLQVLPDKLPPMLKKPPVYPVHYRLAPEVARGSISRYFDEMHITPLPDGSAEITAQTDDEWEAVRILLGYGENCVVLGGDEVLRLMQKRVAQMARNYGLGGPPHADAG